MRINIHNATKSDKTKEEWINNDNYRGSSWRNAFFAEGLALDLFKEKLSKVPFKDESLSQEETERLKVILENKIKELLSTRIPEPNYREKIEFLGEVIKLNGTPFGKNAQDSWIYSLINCYEICEECLKENKPVYLSIREED
ncbi:MAG: hypothetical protein K0R36_3915 [Chryseobacterium sp.]|jgi:hypothetical protein|nr:hypothetical protein [Chryseobacterium sp.]